MTLLVFLAFDKLSSTTYAPSHGRSQDAKAWPRTRRLPRTDAPNVGWTLPEISFTDTQAQYLAFINAYTHVHGRPPAEADTQRYFGISPSSDHQIILTLERAGLLQRQFGLAHSIEVLVGPNACLTNANLNPSESLCRSTRTTKLSGLDCAGRRGRTANKGWAA
jgi:hypothetical protein